MFASGVAAASLLWGISWGIYTRRTEAKQALKIAKEIQRSQREAEGIRVVRSGAISVVQMADDLLETYGSLPAQVSTGQVAIKMSGRLKGLRDPWLRYDRDIRVGGLVRSYERLRMDDSLAWFEGRSADGGTTKATIEEAMRRVQELRGLANALRVSAEEAGA